MRRCRRSTARWGLRPPKTVEATRIAIAVRGPRPSIELKLRSAARLTAFVWPKVAHEIDTIRRKA
jgi:hypothetical protein